MKLPAGFKDWRTTILGFAQAVNGIVAAIQLLQEQNSGIVFIDPNILVRLLLISAVLKAIQGAITPSTAKVEEKAAEIAKVVKRDTAEMVDQKIVDATGVQ